MSTGLSKETGRVSTGRRVISAAGGVFLAALGLYATVATDMDAWKGLFLTALGGFGVWRAFGEPNLLRHPALPWERRRRERERAEVEIRKLRSQVAKHRLAYLMALTERVAGSFLMEADARGWETHPGMPLLGFQNLAEWRRNEAFKAGYMMVAIAVGLEGLAGKDGYSLDDFFAEVGAALTRQQMEMLEREMRGDGFTGEFDHRPDLKLRRAVFDLVALHARKAKECVVAIKNGSAFPWQCLYETLGPGFGRQADEATLAARFDGVVQPLVAELRRELRNRLNA